MLELTKLEFICKILDLRIRTKRKRGLPDPNLDLRK
jgi:hypothetical protein